MDRFLYLVAAHKNPGQLERLVRTIRDGSPRSVVLIHYAGDPEIMVDSRWDGIGGVHFIDSPVDVQWGNFSQVEMLIRSLQWARSNFEFDWLVFISGQDYPIKPISSIEMDLSTAGFDGFLRGTEANRMKHWPRNLGNERYLYRYFDLPRFRYHYRLPSGVQDFSASCREWLNTRQPWIRLKPRYRNRSAKIGYRRWQTPFDSGFRCFAGPLWFSLNRRSVNYLCDYIDRNRKLLTHYRRTLNPDESFFLTILCNNPELRFNGDEKRYVHWESHDSASPQVIHSADFDALRSSSAHFARKFDTEDDENILSRIDHELLQTVREDVG